ncbi:helix-turn-helix domain-containing protein, partial [Streptomyces erythrochromogenes]|uniref:helix-turn-helix domain-containing protein n=1 Tax=Streptomyces erythrochromogenes TaxID=285574 RepID=UPI00369997BB
MEAPGFSRVRKRSSGSEPRCGGVPRREAVTCAGVRIVTDRRVGGVGVPSAQRSRKYRFYPTDAQAVELSRTFGRLRSMPSLRGTAPGRYGNAATGRPAAGAAAGAAA